MSGLALRELTKTFGDLTVLDRVSLELAESELMVLLGPSGCGKSTLLRLVAGLEDPDSGEIYINGKRMNKIAPRARNVALVFQNYSLFPHMTVRKNLAFPLKMANMPRGEIRKKVVQVAEMLGLGDRLESRPGQLSGGQRQRVALGRAIIRDPAIFLLDEPLSNLDADLRHRMRLEIVRIQRQLKKTMIHVTHDQTEALTMADRIGLLHKGELLQVGTPEELYNSPKTQFVAESIGQPRINLIHGRIEAGQLVPLGFPVSGAVGSADRALVIAFRPEHVELSGGGAFEGTVLAAEYLGDHRVVTVRFEDSEIRIRTTREFPISEGDRMKFDVDRHKVLLFDLRSGLRLGD